MKKRFISICLLLILIRVVYIFVDKYQYSDALEQKMSMQTMMGLDMRVRVKDHNEINMNEMILALKEKKTMEQYFGIYEITEFLPSLYYSRGWHHDFLLAQEADMMLGHIVEIQEGSLITYECFRWHRIYNGEWVVWSGNYQIQKVAKENPEYEWDAIDCSSMSPEEIEQALRDGVYSNYQEEIRGRITVTIESVYVQEYYVMEDGIVMYSTMTGECFYLKKLDEKPDKAMPAEELSDKEKEKIIQDIYGSYIITAFLPTKFYPALDVSRDVLLPQEEADMMLGREVIISERLFTTYDNRRLPNSQVEERPMDEYLLTEIEIAGPDYRLERKGRDDIYGLRDDMLPEEMVQGEYVEINVYPGYGELPFKDVLPQMYLLNDGRLLLYAMGEYFLLEKKENSAVEVEAEEYFADEYGYPYIDYDYIEKHHEIVAHHISASPAYDYENTVLAEYLAEDIELDEELQRNAPGEGKPLAIDYHVFDLNDDGLEDYLVCLQGTYWSQDDKNMARIYIQEERNTLRCVFEGWIHFHDEGMPGKHAPVAVLEERAGGCHSLAVPGMYALLRYDGDSGEYKYRRIDSYWSEASAGDEIHNMPMGMTLEEYEEKKALYEDMAGEDMGIFIDYDFLEVRNQIKNHNICVSPRSDYEDTPLEGYLQDDLEQSRQAYEQGMMSQPLSIDYFLFDFNDDGLEDYLVCCHGASWEENGEDQVFVYIQESNGSLRKVFSMMVKLHEPAWPGGHAPIAVLHGKVGDFYRFVLPGTNHIVAYNREKGEYEW